MCSKVLLACCPPTHALPQLPKAHNCFTIILTRRKSSVASIKQLLETIHFASLFWLLIPSFCPSSCVSCGTSSSGIFHLSGSNSSLPKTERLRWTPYAKLPTTVPGGMYRPSITLPCLNARETTLGRVLGIAVYSLNVSLRTASR